MTPVPARAAVWITAIAALSLGVSTSSDAQAPTIDITSPLGRIASAGAVRIVAQLRAESDEGAIVPVSAVRFFVDDAPVGEDAEGPVYAVDWADENPFAPVTIRAEAVGVDGLVGVDTVTLPALDVTDETSVASVLLDVAVMDGEGKYIQKLTRENFSLFEDGIAQTLDLVDATIMPTTHTLLVDTSQSMSYRFDFVRRAARRLGSTMRERDQMVVLPFAAGLGAMTGPTTDLQTIASAVETMHSKGGTAIVDALIAASERLEHVEGRHIIVLITDAYDEHSEGTLDDAVDALRQRHTTLYTVGIGGAAGISIRGRAALKALAEKTGGKAFFPHRDEELPLVQDRVAADIASKYLLTYTPTNQERDGAWRRVQIVTGDPTHTIRTRDGYFAAAPIPIRPTLEFTARDANRRLLTIDASNLIVIEDGVEQTVTSFQEASEPVSIVMALDKSGSMRQEEEAVKAAAHSFIDSLRAEDKLGVVGFSDGAEMLADVAPYRTWSRHAVNQYRTNGGTALYDGLGLALERLEAVKGRRAIVVMTDGRDENNPGTAPGSKLTFDDIVQRLAQTNVTVYAIGLGAKVDRMTLERLAEVTTGEAYFPADVSMLAAEYRRVTEDLRRRYLVGYTSTNSKHDGNWRMVELKSRTEGIVFTSKGGYEAPAK
jgi:VWFA-related protein